MKQPLITDTYLKAILEDDPVGLRKLYHDFFPMIRRLVQENNGTENDAKDVFQDALGFIFEKRFLLIFDLPLSSVPIYMVLAGIFGAIN
jgi:hypothetical protein